MNTSSTSLRSEYITSLAQRATVPLLKLFAAAQKKADHGPKPRHRPEVYSADLIEALLMLRVQLNLSFRTTLAIAGVFLQRHGFPAVRLPCDSHLARRNQAYGARFQTWTDRQRPCRPGETEAHRNAAPLRDRIPLDPDQFWVPDNITQLLETYDEHHQVWVGLDSTGLSVKAPGLWRRDKPGGEKPPVGQTSTGQKQNGIREYAKVHTATDLATGRVLAVWVTRSGVTDNLGGEYLLRRLQPYLHGRTRTVVADGAYDDRAVYTVMQELGVTQSLIRPPAKAKVAPEDPAYALRNVMVNLATRHRHIIPGDASWRELTGYHVRSLTETTFSVLTQLTGSRLRSRSESGQLAEIHWRMELLNGYRSCTRSPLALTDRAASVQAAHRDELIPLPTGTRYVRRTPVLRRGRGSNP